MPTCRKWLVALFNAAAERGDIARDADIDGAVDMLMIIADGVWWRRALDPNFQAGCLDSDFHGRHTPPAARRRAACCCERGKIVMKASRITAVGLVVAAALWIASGHLIPHESRGEHAALRAGETKSREAIPRRGDRHHVVPHSRKLLLSGRTEADSKVTLSRAPVAS